MATIKILLRLPTVVRGHVRGQASALLPLLRVSLLRV